MGHRIVPDKGIYYWFKTDDVNLAFNFLTIMNELKMPAVPFVEDCPKYWVRFRAYSEELNTIKGLFRLKDKSVRCVVYKRKGNKGTKEYKIKTKNKLCFNILSILAKQLKLQKSNGNALKYEVCYQELFDEVKRLIKVFKLANVVVIEKNGWK